MLSIQNNKNHLKLLSLFDINYINFGTMPHLSHFDFKTVNYDQLMFFFNVETVSSSPFFHLWI